MSREIIAPQNRVVFFDLDETLVDKDYQITDIKVVDSMREMQQQGWILGLNSDTPLSALEVWSDRFGLKGPIIGERGGVVKYEGKVWCDEKLSAIFGECQKRIVNMAKYLPHSYVWEGDQVDLLRRGDRLPQAIGLTAILVGNLRSISASFHIRKVDNDGRLINDVETYNNVIGVLRDSYPKLSSLLVDENSEYGIVILSSSEVTKRVGMQKIMSLASWTQVGMVGDSDTDFVGHDLAVQYAVANSRLSYTQRADYLAGGSYATGVKEICDLLIRRGV